MTGPQPRAHRGPGGGHLLPGPVPAHPRGRGAWRGGHEARRSPSLLRAAGVARRRRHARGRGGWYGYDALARKPDRGGALHRRDGARGRRPTSSAWPPGCAGARRARSRSPRVREAVKRLPWVRDCAVRRVFPGTLEVSIEAHVPLARWDDTRLVSVRGEVFAADYEARCRASPGPRAPPPRWPRPGRASGGPPRRSRARSRSSRLTRAPGLAGEARLGARDRARARRHRGAPGALRGRVAAAAAEAAAGATHADLRYPNGFALRGVAGEERRNAPKGRRA